MKNDFEAMVNELEVETIEDMANWLYINKAIDYSYTTFKEAKTMIVEDYYNWKLIDKVNNVIAHLVDEIENDDLAYACLCANIGAVRVEDNGIEAAVVELMANYYDLEIVD